MELLLKLLNPRLVVFFFLLAAAGVYALSQVELAADSIQRWRYPPQGPKGPQGRDIIDGLELSRQRRVEATAARLRGLLTTAKINGFRVDHLELRLEEALRLNLPSTRWRVQEILAELEMQIPRKPVPVVPTSASAENSDETPAPEAKPVKRRASSRKRR